MPNAMILAAGSGTRLGALTHHKPKVLIPVAGKPLIVYQIESLVRAGIRNIVINTAHLGAMIHTALGDGSQFNAQIQYSDECEGGLESAGGIIQALPLLGSDPFIVTSGDIITEYHYANMRQSLPDHCLAHIILLDNPGHNIKGDFNISNHLLAHPPEQKKYDYTYSNIALFHPDFFADYAPGFRKLGDLLRRKASQNLISTEHFTGYWRNVNTPEEIARLEAEMTERLA